ncbi:hypothetical protein H8959_022375 [Pygathrix nigripes]
MTMEKGMSSGEGLPSRSSQVSAGKITAKELEAKQSYKEKRGGFVLVHAGAGYHSESKAKEYKHVCKRACQKAIEKLQAGALATDAVTAALLRDALEMFIVSGPQPRPLVQLQELAIFSSLGFILLAEILCVPQGDRKNF